MKKKLPVLFFFIALLLDGNLVFAGTQTYNIGTGNLINCSNNCGGAGDYNPCDGTQFGFSWTDVIPGGNNITSVSIQFIIGVECNGASTYPTYLNGTAQGTFTDASNGCSCAAISNGITTINAASANYVRGGANTFLITPGASCVGFTRTMTGGYDAIITVNYAPSCVTPTAGSISPSATLLCAGTPVTINSTVNATAPSATLYIEWYRWNYSSSTWTYLGQNNSQTITDNPGAGQYYYLRRAWSSCYGDCSSGCIDATTGTVTFDVTPVQGTVSNAGPINFCDAGGNWSAIPISVSGSTGVVWWQFGWSSGGWSGDWVSGTSPSYCCFPSKVASSDGNADRIRWYVKSANGGCTATGYSSSILLPNHYNAAPTSLTASANPVCSGTGITLTANFSSNIDILGTVDFFSGSCGGTLLYSITAGDNVNSVTTPSFTPPVGTTNYFARYNPGAGTGCSVTACASVAVTSNAAPTASNAGGPQIICTSGSATLAANNPATGTGAWAVFSGPSTSSAQFSSASAYNATFTPAGGAGSYVLTWTVSNAPCAPSSSNVTITVNNCPVAIQVVFPSAGPTTYVVVSNGTNVNGGSYFVVGNPATNAIVNAGTTGGWFISENQYNYLDWQQITATNSYVMPLGYNTTDYLPFTFGKTAGAASDLIVSTWGTGAANTPKAGATDVVAVSNMMDATGTDETTGPTYHVIDRWWTINTTATANLSFTYRGQENTMTNPTDEIAIQHWTGSAWNDGNGGSGGSFTSTGTAGIQGTVPHTVTGSTNCNQFSPYVLVDKNSPLPVKFLGISAICEHGDVTIKWSTASEQNSDYFTVERSLDGTNFSAIATVPAAVNSSTVKNYSSVDNDAYSGTSYYRITETDNNGQTQSFAPVSVSCSDNSDFSVTVNPNPVSDGTIYVSVNGAANKNVLVVLTDVLGREVYTKMVVGQSNGYIFSINLQDQLAAGVYFVTASSNERYISKKIIINK